MESLAFPSIDPSSPPAFITVTATRDVDPLTRALRDAFQDAMALRSRLEDAAFRVDGFAGKKFRMLLNNLLNELPDSRYLEIGLYHGASFCSAVHANGVQAVGIDNWSDDDGERAIFDGYLSDLGSETADVEILDQDCRDVPYETIGKFNVMHYDGPHEEEGRFDAIFRASAAMDDRYILIVSDWNLERVRSGTFDALRDAWIAVDYSIEVRTSFDGKRPSIHGPRSEWHNGVLLAVVSKS